MNVTAIIVTRGNVDLTDILASIPAEWQVVVWDNNGTCEVYDPPRGQVSRVVFDVSDVAVYGRYAAIEHAAGDLIYVQDDDVLVSDPAAIVRVAATPTVWMGMPDEPPPGPLGGPAVVCNMPPEFRHDFYREHALVGFGACFHRDTPARAFERFSYSSHRIWADAFHSAPAYLGLFERCCDVLFTALTPRVLVDVPVENLPWATADDRMYRQPEHVGERQRMLEFALQVRDM